MTAINPAIQAWAARPAGKAVRIAIATLGMATSTLVLMTAALVTTGSWALVLLGVGLAATSVRAALAPTTPRLLTVATIIIAIPLTLQAF